VTSPSLTKARADVGLAPGDDTKESRDISELFLNLQGTMTLSDIHPVADEDNNQVDFCHA